MWNCVKYFGSILVLLVAVGIGTLTHLSRKPRGILIDLAGTNDAAQAFSPVQLSPQQIEDYHRDGAVLVKGLLSAPQVARITKASKEAPLPMSPFDFFKNSYTSLRFDLWRVDPTMAQLALRALPPVAAQVLDDGNSFRVLRDAYFSYASGGQGCGWHVDDAGFWPTSEESSGLTIWIALNDMAGGGGLVVVNQTHLGEEWVSTCRAAIKGNTCNMRSVHPECHAKMEESKMDGWDVKAGDAILWDRWTFHRTVTVNATSNEEEAFLKNRYSIRYIPSTARAQGAIHKSVTQGSLFVGSPYYPQVWPSLLEEEVAALRNGLESDITLLSTVGVMWRILYKKAILPRLLHFSK